MIWTHSSSHVGGGEADFKILLKRLYESNEYELTGILPGGNDIDQLTKFFVKHESCRPALFPLSCETFRSYVAYIIFSTTQILQIRKFLSTLHFDAVMLFSSSLVMPFLYLLLKRKGKLILFVRELITPHWIRKLLFKFIFSKADLIITVSQFLQDDIQKTIQHPNVSTVYSLPSLPKIQSYSKKEKQDARFHLAIVGPVSPIKGHDILIKALQDTCLHRFSIVLHIIGKKVNRGSRKYFMRYFDGLLNGLPPNINLKFHGPLPYQELLNFFLTIDLLIIPSRTEGLSLTLMEAILLKVPVIASRIGEMKKILIEGKNGFLFTSEDAEGLAQKIEDLINDVELLKEIRSQNGELPNFLGDAESNWRRLKDGLTKLSC